MPTLLAETEEEETSMATTTTVDPSDLSSQQDVALAHNNNDAAFNKGNTTRKKVVIAIDNVSTKSSSKDFSDEDAELNDVEAGLAPRLGAKMQQRGFRVLTWGRNPNARRSRVIQGGVENGSGFLSAIAEGDDERSRCSSSAAGSKVASIAPSFSGLKNRTQLFSILIFVLGCGAAAAFLSIGILGAKREQDDQFQDHSEVVVNSIQSSFAKYEVAGLHVHHACRNGITRQAFRELYEALLATGIEFQVTSYNPNTTHEEREVLEEESRSFYSTFHSDIVPNYQGIRGLEPNVDGGLSVQPRSEQPFYFPVHYLEPVESNVGAIDFDLYSSPSRRQTIDQVLSTWKPALTPRLSLVQEAVEGSYGVILMHPGTPLSTQPNLTTHSFSSMVVRIPDLITAATQHLDRSLVYIYDSTESKSDPNEEPAFLGGAEVGGERPLFQPEISYHHLLGTSSRKHRDVTRIDIASRQWDIIVIAVDGSYEPVLTFVIVGGTIIFAASIFLAFWLYANGNRQIKLSQIRSKNESEKATLILDSMAKTAKAERDLNDFIAHEVRNPLSAAMSACTFVKSETVALKTTDAAEDRKESIMEDIDIVQSSLEHINELLRNLLDAQRAASNQLRMELGPTDLYHDVLKPIDAMIYRRGANFQVFCECDPKDLCVESDRLRLKQIVLNLARNSVKFVEKGFIRIRTAVVNGLVHLYVEDSGPGIPKAKEQQLFAKFQESLDSLNQGTGIGLSLCKNLANLLGADLWYDPDYDSGVEGCPGARFVLNLMKPPVTLTDMEIDTLVTQVSDHEGSRPSRKTGDGAPADNLSSGESSDAGATSLSDDSFAGEMGDGVGTEKDEDVPQNLSVLFVDDALVLRKLFARSIKRAAPTWTFQEAANGESALQMVDEGATFDVIFMDQYMASVEKQLLGTETVRALRSKGVNSFICGLSANDLRDAFLEAGANAFLMKPLPSEPNELKRELSRLLVK